MISFVLNNKLIETHENAGITLLDFIRREQHLPGTKIGCREGDCGACTILVGSLQNTNEVGYKSITSCISPLGNAHGKHIVTVEGINLNDSLNAVQEHLKNNNATQCGFCTPGFVMSLVGLSLQNTLLSKDDALMAISGNICRCTGYKSIEKATYKIFEDISKTPFNNRVKWLIDNRFLPSYFLDIADKLQKIKPELHKTDKGVLVAGGTDLYVQKADTLADASVNLIAHNSTLTGITFYQDRCIIGAETTVSDLYYNSAMLTYFPEMRSYLKLISSEQIRNMASIAGNFVNASPIGDLSIFFLALNSEITLQKGTGSLRTLFLKDFFKDYKVTDLKEDERIVSIAFTVPKVNYNFNFEKVSKRTHLDISSVNTALQMEFKDNTIHFIFLAMGGVAPVPLYLKKTCLFLTGQTLTKDTLKEAEAVLQNEIKPISDVRGDKAYKRLLAKQLFYAHFLKLFPHIFKVLELVK